MISRRLLPGHSREEATNCPVAPRGYSITTVASFSTLVVAGTQRWWTQKTVAFARFARECGADMVITAPADWAQNNNDDLLLAHYKAVAQELPIMLMTALGKRPVPLNVIEETVNTVPGLIAIKDDICGHYGQHVATVARKGGVTLLSGGRMENHLEVYPYGSNSWLSIFMLFMPRIVWGYWEAVQARNMSLGANRTLKALRRN